MPALRSRGESAITIFLQFLALALLSIGLGLGYWFLARSYTGSLSRQQSGALWLTLLALAGGLIGSPFWWLDLKDAFSWDLPPLAARMLAAAGIAFFTLCWLALRRLTLRRLRLVMLALVVYLLPLALAIVIFHLDRFDPTAPITYAFFAIVLLMVGGSAWYLWRPVGLAPEADEDRQPSGPWQRRWLDLLAVGLGLWGLALFLTDQGPLEWIWVWPGDLLSSRLIGVMLLTIAAGALYSRASLGLARLWLATTTVYGLGIALAGLWSVFQGKPLKLSYVLAFGVIFLVSLLLVRQRNINHTGQGE